MSRFSIQFLLLIAVLLQASPFRACEADVVLTAQNCHDLQATGGSAELGFTPHTAPCDTESCVCDAPGNPVVRPATTTSPAAPVTIETPLLPHTVAFKPAALITAVQCDPPASPPRSLPLLI